MAQAVASSHTCTPPLPHILMVSLPAQGNFNPLLRLGKCLASKGLLITITTTEAFGKSVSKANNMADDSQPIPVGQGMIRFEYYDDEWETNTQNCLDYHSHVKHLRVVGKKNLNLMIDRSQQQGRPVSCIINNPFEPWVSDVAHERDIPSAVLWMQSCANFAAYFYYYHGVVSFPTEQEPELDVKLPCMPMLKHDEIPSFLHPFSPSVGLGQALLGQFKNLEKPFCILMETFLELEPELIQFMNTSDLCPPIKPIGPLFKNNPTASHIRGYIMKPDEDCLTWLDSKPASSVVYISFGSLAQLKQKQVDELAHALLSSNVSFMWVMRLPKEHSPYEAHVLPEGFLERVGESKGKIVEWCPQEEVLAHPSISCFFTHCGWNSTMEALTNGVPLLAFPQWGDQVTNAKFLVDVYGVAIRVCRGEAEDRIIHRDEIVECLVEATSEVKAEEIRKNALKWKKKAEEAVAEGGSSADNLLWFVDELMVRRKKSH